MLYANFNREYSLELEAFGGGTVCEETLGSPDKKYEAYREQFACEPEDVSLKITDTHATGLDYWFTGIDTAYLERIDKLKELILPDTITVIEMTDKLSGILKDNNTLIRGSLDSFAERFAEENGLNFRPSDFVIGRNEFEPAHEITVVSILFRRDGSVVAESDVSSTGSSAGNSFGGTFTKEIPGDFWINMTAEELVEKYSISCRRAILESGRLAAFIDKAKDHRIYTGKN